MSGRVLGRRGLDLVVGLVVTLVLVSGTPEARAAETHVFDPVLSLTGGCKTQPVDTVPDPGPCPGVPEVDHPSTPFSSPVSVATDSYGDIYVVSYGKSSAEGAEGRIDIFDPKGNFIMGFADEAGPRNAAIDDEGNLYVFEFRVGLGKPEQIRRFAPSAYEPLKGKIAYENAPTLVTESVFGSPFVGLAINSSNQHLFANFGHSITEYGSAAEKNKVLEEFGGKTLSNNHGIGLAIDTARGRIYASDLKHSKEFPDPAVVRVFELESPHALLETIDGSSTPPGKFLSNFLSLAVDEATGNVFVYDGEGAEVVYELTEHGEYLASIDHELSGHWSFGAEITVDNGAKSPDGALNPHGRYLFVPAYPTGIGHSFAFGPPAIGPPEIEAVSFSGISESEALLEATIEPFSLETVYSFEYITQQQFEEEGDSFANAEIAAVGQIPAGAAPVKVSAPLEELTPGTAYLFRVVAENEKGGDEAQDEFATYTEAEPGPLCENEALRTGFSALLPDCRAYELVTPPDTNARAPMGFNRQPGYFFASRKASPGGEALSFLTEGGTIPGLGGTGSLAGDPYLSTRGTQGWSTASAGPSGVEAEILTPGATSPDQGYSFWSTGTGEGGHDLRYPDGHSALIGRGSLAVDRQAEGKLISKDGSHVVFVSSNFGHPAIQLEPNAPPEGTQAVYDRTIEQETGEEETHVVSLLPGNATPAAGENAGFEGASLDGKGIAFKIGKKLYLRYNDEETYEVGENVTFAGVAEGGTRIFYLEGGDLFVFDAEAEEMIRFTEAGNVTPVNVAADGTAAYFVSPSVLTGEEENPNGDTAQPGEENLYLSREGTISFVGTVTERDVEGEVGATEKVGGLGLWTTAVGSATANAGRLGIDPSRTTPDGNALLFESRAELAGYDPEGHAEVYRYDSTGEELECLSCNPTLAPATSDASLQSISQVTGDPEPLTGYALVANLRADGSRALFQSIEPLVAGDTDGRQDVYEWEEEGVGSCERPEGCIYLISSGHSRRTDYLYAVSDSGDDVFFRTSDRLLPVDTESTPSIYDARVGGGFPEPNPVPCQDLACKGPLSGPPALPTPTTPPSSEPQTVHCPKGKHKVTKNGKTSCVKNKKKHQKHHRASSKQKGAGK